MHGDPEWMAVEKECHPGGKTRRRENQTPQGRHRQDVNTVRYRAAMRVWRVRDISTLFSHRIFRLERHAVEAGPDVREAMVLRAPDWVNVIAREENDRVLMVRQWRYGIAAPTLEIPGGMIDEGESDRAAAERELYEETGYRAATWSRLGEVHPNPAFLANRCSTWIAQDLTRIGDPPGDGEEEIAVESVPLADIPARVVRGEISHALVIAAFYLLENSSRR